MMTPKRTTSLIMLTLPLILAVPMGLFHGNASADTCLYDAAANLPHRIGTHASQIVRDASGNVIETRALEANGLFVDSQIHIAWGLTKLGKSVDNDDRIVNSLKQFFGDDHQYQRFYLTDELIKEVKHHHFKTGTKRVALTVSKESKEYKNFCNDFSISFASRATQI